MANIDYSSGKALPGLQAFAYILGSDKHDGAVHIFDLSNPVSPVEVTTPGPLTQYSHDATNLVIDDSRTADCKSGSPPPGGHNPCELLVDYNEDTVDIWDVTDKSAPLLLSSTLYSNGGYTQFGMVESR